MTNEVGKAMFSKAGELGVPVGFMCMKVYKSSWTPFDQKGKKKSQFTL